MSTRKALAVIAALLLAGGFLFVSLPVSVPDREFMPTDVACGSAFSATPDAAAYGIEVQEKCDDALAVRRWIGFPAAAIGALVLLFLLLTSTGVASSAEQSQPARP